MYRLPHLRLDEFECFSASAKKVFVRMETDARREGSVIDLDTMLLITIEELLQPSSGFHVTAASRSLLLEWHGQLAGRSSKRISTAPAIRVSGMLVSQEVFGALRTALQLRENRGEGELMVEDIFAGELAVDHPVSVRLRQELGWPDIGELGHGTGIPDVAGGGAGQDARLCTIGPDEVVIAVYRASKLRYVLRRATSWLLAAFLDSLVTFFRIWYGVAAGAAIGALLLD